MTQQNQSRIPGGKPAMICVPKRGTDLWGHYFPGAFGRCLCPHPEDNTPAKFRVVKRDDGEVVFLTLEVISEDKMADASQEKVWTQQHIDDNGDKFLVLKLEGRSESDTPAPAATPAAASAATTERPRAPVYQCQRKHPPERRGGKWPSHYEGNERRYRLPKDENGHTPWADYHHPQAICATCRKAIMIPHVNSRGIYNKVGDLWPERERQCSQCAPDDSNPEVFNCPPIERRQNSVQVIVGTDEDGEPLFTHIAASDHAKYPVSDVQFYVVINFTRIALEEAGGAGITAKGVVVYVSHATGYADSFLAWAKQRGDIFEVGKSAILKGFSTLDKEAIEVARLQVQNFFKDSGWHQRGVRK